MSMAEWSSWSCADVGQWLTETAGFPQYAEVFRLHEITGDILPELTNEVLRVDLGIPAFGHRVRLLQQIQALTTAAPVSRPPLHSPPPSTANSGGETTSVGSGAKGPNQTRLDLAVLHAAPLVIRDGQNRLFPMEKLDLGAERRAITNSLLEELRDKDIHVRFDVATSEGLRRVMTMTGCKVLHFSGHGLGVKPALCFEDGVGCTQLVTPDMLKDLAFAGTNTTTGGSQLPTQLVFVNSCHSENVARVFLEAGIPHVVAVHSNTLVVDATATMFAKHFYLSLLSGDTVQSAFEVARAFIRTLPASQRGACCCAHLHEPSCEWLQAGSSHKKHVSGKCCCKGHLIPYPHDESSKFLLLGSSSHDVVLFDHIPCGKLQDHTPFIKSSIPSIHGQFLGRCIEMYVLVKAVQENAVTTCIGAPGIGKSSLAISVAQFAHSRRIFSDGVFYVDLEGHKLSTVRFAIAQSMRIAAAESDDEAFVEIGSLNCLVVLDKVEGLLDENEEGTQQLLHKLIRLAPRVRLLIASRRSPQLSNVTSYTLSLTQLPLRSAAELLCMMSPGCPRTTAERLAKMCGCLPLAIRVIGRALANARSTVTPEQMLERLEGPEHRLENMKELNQVGQRECIDRCIRSSFGHLEEPYRLAFMALGFFRGSFDETAVGAILLSTSQQTHRCIEREASLSSNSSSSSFFPEFAYARSISMSQDEDLATLKGLGSLLAGVDGFTFENDGVFTKASYEILNQESDEELIARGIRVASAREALRTLHRWSLIEHDTRSKRYRLHSLIQLFAEEEAIHLGNIDENSDQQRCIQGRELLLTWRRRFVRHYCAVVANASHEYRYNGDLSQFDKERANIESAVRIAHLLATQAIDRMREVRRCHGDAVIEQQLVSLDAFNNTMPKSQLSSFGQVALIDTLVYANIVARSRFILRTRLDAPRRLEVLSKCLQIVHETRSLYCTCGCTENEASNLLWDIEEVKYDRPLESLDSIPSYLEPREPEETFFPCSCSGMKELLGLETLLLVDLGYASCDADDWVAGEYYYLEAIRIQRDVLGWGENAQVAEVLNQFSICLSTSSGNMAYNIWLIRHSERLLKASMLIRGRVLGENHPEYATSLNNLANFYKNFNTQPKKITSNKSTAYSRAGRSRHFRFRDDKGSRSAKQAPPVDKGSLSCGNSATNDDWAEDVEQLYRRSLAIRELTLGRNHPHVAQSLNNLALWLSSRLDASSISDLRMAPHIEEINKLFDQALAIRRATLGNANFETAATLNNIGNFRRLQRDWACAEENIREALRVISRFDSAQGPRAARMYINLGRVHKDQGNYAKAIEAFSSARDIRLKACQTSRDVGYCFDQIGKCMILQGRLAEGQELEALGRLMKKHGIVVQPHGMDCVSEEGMSLASDRLYLSIRIVDIGPREMLLSPEFNFPKRLLGDRGINMKRIEAITCSNARYFGPWPSAVAHRDTSRVPQLVDDAHIKLTSMTELTLNRAREHCFDLLKTIAAEWGRYNRRHRPSRHRKTPSK